MSGGSPWPWKLPDEALLFPTLDGSLGARAPFSKEWSDVAASIGVQQATFHSLRHTHASHLIDAGIDVVKISRASWTRFPGHYAARLCAFIPKGDDKSSKAIDDAVASLLA